MCRRVLPGAEERRAVAARLGSAGAVLVGSLDEVERRAAAAVAATGLQREAVTAWQNALCTSGRRLEAAWLALEDAVDGEAAHWRRVADEVSHWRPKLWPMLVLAGLAVGVAVWFGLVLGGYVSPPEWLRSVWSRVLGP